ncbi:MAG: bifunctional pantoate--beta-alanine ligase/(d)CMP kinase [Gloeobacterales cyanobacterium]
MRVSTLGELQEYLGRLAHPLGFVPTMGALHKGHRSLMQWAKVHNQSVVVSIFVNPLQFGPTEDLDRYPRTEEEDLLVCEEEGIDLVFTPTPEILYPQDREFTLVVPPAYLTDKLCGKSRPGHFTGVATIVAKLLHLIQPDRAYFGQKDAQQLAVVQQMVQDLNMPVEIFPCPIVRDQDGLALSSRNQYLSPQERVTALMIPQTLAWAKQQQSGVMEAQKLSEQVAITLSKEPGMALEYCALVDPHRLEPVSQLSRTPSLLMIAAKVGTTRLIDNVTLDPRPPVIALDGPAGVGKSTLAKLLAQKLGFLYIDTGAMYRAVTWAVLQHGLQPVIEAKDKTIIGPFVKSLDLRLKPGTDPAYPTRVWLNGSEITQNIRTQPVTDFVSQVSAVGIVREALVAQQRKLAAGGGIVMDGRDIGTEVFPQAPVKIYLTASVEARALRRQQDLQEKKLPIPDLEILKKDIRERDYKDSTRKQSPLRKAPDALEVCTDDSTIEETLGRLLAIYEARIMHL